MQNPLKTKLFSLLAVSVIAPSAWAGITYNTPITAIYGSGNPNAGWTADTEANGLQLALRAKDRVTGAAVNTLGTYSYATAPATRGLWNYEFSINSGANSLVGYDFWLAVDRDSSVGINLATINPLAYWGDDSYGNNGTLAGQGVETGLAAALAAGNNIAQNSENITFGDYPYPWEGGLPLAANATYSYELYAVAAGAGQNGARLADVSITVNVGAGGGPHVPDGGASLLLLGIGIAGIAGLRRKFAA